MAKFVELKVTEYQIFEIEDNVTYKDIEEMYEKGELLMDNPHTSYLDAQITDSKSKLDGNYENIF